VIDHVNCLEEGIPDF